MATLVMGRTRSPQADAIRELYFTECATAMRRTALKDGRVRVAFYRRGDVDPQGRAVQETDA